MTLNHDEDNCTAVLDDNQSELTFFESDHQKAKHGTKGFKKKPVNPDACDPEIIPPAAKSLEGDINSEFYPEIYIPKKKE